MPAMPVGNASPEAVTSTLDAFFKALEERTKDAVHLRLLQAARKPDPEGALEKELARIVKEIVDET